MIYVQSILSAVLCAAIGVFIAETFRVRHRVRILEMLVQGLVVAADKRNSERELERVNVNVQRVEVRSDDPDAFVFGLADAFNAAADGPDYPLLGRQGRARIVRRAPKPGDPPPTHFTTDPEES